MYNVVLEASLGYTALCSVVVMDEVTSLNKRVDDDLVEMKEETSMTMRRVRELEGRLENEQEAHLQLARQVGELTQELREIRRQIGLPSTSLAIRGVNTDEAIDVETCKSIGGMEDHEEGPDSDQVPGASCQGHSTQCSQCDKCLFCGQTSPTSHCQ